MFKPIAGWIKSCTNFISNELHCYSRCSLRSKTLISIFNNLTEDRPHAHVCLTNKSDQINLKANTHVEYYIPQMKTNPHTCTYDLEKWQLHVTIWNLTYYKNGERHWTRYDEIKNLYPVISKNNTPPYPSPPPPKREGKNQKMITSCLESYRTVRACF